jgi:hypothetical protein
VKIGRAAAPWISWARTRRVLGLHQLWEWEALEPEGEDLTQLYVSSWLWVHYLMNNHQDRFADFQARLAAMEPARAAFAAAFAGAEWDEEERKLREYMFDGHYVVLDFALPAVDTRASERALEPAEIHALRAELYAENLRDLPAERQASALRAELDVARREAPAAFHTALMEATYVQEGEDPLPPARALVAAHPGRKEAWALLSEQLVTHPSTFEERETTLRRALELAPEEPFLLGLLAWTYVSERQPQKALSPSARAVRLSPWSANALNTYAAALAGVGRCPEAHSVQLQAVSALADAASPTARREFQARLATYERCAKPAARTPR